ncbi:undecaprenyldiphospho-muramoylpentapeptide beta-N-acetylglucosaminyltransferase [Bowdeniella nasicola]|uniref:undecaprenyldiphospho-muramoylpentapeptide beta-N-acetylglucosaminyltransferase n=1 Tax=Bowdeniella nasicola TaxID=208480 RepID=UPI000AFFF9FC|nr:undecaprenyldiphospho-muramoylpentapeptide beta-N-acetylglucosaminyltransferase [Bowdeniella nasicola]
MIQSIVLAGGGSAGHVNPLLATASEIAERCPAARITALGVATGLETELVPAAGIDLVTIPKAPMPRKPTPSALMFPVRFREAISQVRSVLAETKADLIVGFGGYVATPAYLAAWRAGLPFVIHEQNARPGYANKLGAKRAAVVALTFESTPLAAARGRTVTTGLPLRGPVLDLARRRRSGDGAWAREQAATELGLDPHRTTVLITGGSLGAQSINRAAAQIAPYFAERGAQVLHLTGVGKADDVRERLAGADSTHYHVREYLSAMHQAYAAADVVICRSGAGTVAELTALGLPAIYIPLPIGNGEQRKNAADVLDAGGGLLLPDAELTTASLTAALSPWLTDPAALRQAGEAAASVGGIDGARKLVDEIERVMA